MTALTFLVAVLFAMVIALTVAVFALARQVGVLFERIAPMGALVNDSGPKIGEASPRFTLETLTATAPVVIGPAERAKLVFFLSPTCPVCKKLLPMLTSLSRDERAWIEVVLASDGGEARHREFIARQGLQSFPYVLSSDLGMTYRVQRLPFAVLLDAAGVVQSKGLINNREHLESLLNAFEVGAASAQQLSALRSAS